MVPPVLDVQATQSWGAVPGNFLASFTTDISITQYLTGFMEPKKVNQILKAVHEDGADAE